MTLVDILAYLLGVFDVMFNTITLAFDQSLLTENAEHFSNSYQIVDFAMQQLQIEHISGLLMGIKKSETETLAYGLCHFSAFLREASQKMALSCRQFAHLMLLPFL
jgi:hypothetical protein